MTISNLGLAILATFIAVIHGEQTFLEQPSYTEVNSNGVAVLRCRIADIGGKCWWFKNGVVVGIEQNKYEWTGDPSAGDCSLTVRSTDLAYDQGNWQCQVSASSFKNQDQLSSPAAQLLVRIRPKEPVLQYSGIELQPSGGAIAVTAGTHVQFQCRVAAGNPPALVTWYIGDRDISSWAGAQLNISDSGSSSSSSSSSGSSGTYTALSTLSYTYSRSDRGQMLRCVANHGAYPDDGTSTVSVTIDLEYAPETRIVGIPDEELEENVSSVELKCETDANPAAKVHWTFTHALTGVQEVFFVETLQLQPVARDNAGTYQCLAENSVGKSQPISAELDVKYGPIIKSLTPSRTVTVAMGNSTVMTCEASGNPPPAYQWLHRSLAPGGAIHERGHGPTLRIVNVSYNNAGSYVCVARNVIGGEERRVQSQAVDLQVTGGPQLLRQQMSRQVEVDEGERGEVVAVFCSNPHPISAVWGWGSARLAAGKRQGRFQAEPLKADIREHCYRARLYVDLVSRDDQRRYFLEVTNEAGSDRHGVTLTVKEPVTMTTVIVVISACLLLLVLVVSLLLYAYRAEKCCFTQKSGFKPTDLESDRSEIDGGDVVKSHLGVIPPDALYSAPRKSQIRQSPISSQCEGENSSIENGGSYGTPAFTGGQVRAPSRSSVIYADLQLPKTSNNGSMRKQRFHGQRIVTTPNTTAAAAANNSLGHTPFYSGHLQRADI